MLPIYDVESRIVEALRGGRRLILSAPTGSGKSTQVPQMLLKHGFLESGEVVVLQPRRLAARMLAKRVAEELGVELGKEVGYQVRFESAVSAATKIRFVTEGILLRRMIDDPRLPGVAALVFDEFHERHLYGDVTLARALDARPELRLIVMSATLDVERLDDYLAPCAKVTSEGRTFPVAIEHHVSDAPVWEQAADVFARWEGEGDVLIFMPGGYEISRTMEAIRARGAKGFDVLPLHGELSPRDQDAAVAKTGRRKVVVATNVAETSITIDGVRLVIDSGLARIARYDPNRGINTLLVEKISRASADQRAGRAGRTAPGTCARLWPSQETRQARELPEVKRLDLAEVVLALKDAGVADVRTFRWLEAPTETGLADAERLLEALGALKGGAITALGRRMLKFPLHPRWSRMLLAGPARPAALLAALAQGRDLLLRNCDRETEAFRERILADKETSDFWRLVKAYRWAEKQEFKLDACRRAGIHAVTARQVGPLLQQILRIAEKEGLDLQREGTEEALRKSVLTAFPDRVARRLDEGTSRCELVGGRRGNLAKESVVRHAPLLVAAEAREVEGKELHTILSLATAVEPAWLKELFPEAISTRVSVSYDSGARKVVAAEELCFRDLPLESKALERPPAEEAARLLAVEVVAGRLPLEGWDHAVEQWIERVNLVAKHAPELGVSEIDEAGRRALMEQLCAGASSYKEIKGRSVMAAVKSWLDAAGQALVDQQAPERLTMSNGKTPKVTYAPEGPYIALKIQDLFGVTKIPALALGRVTPLVHILAPSQRPVQVTRDLEGFWREHYPRIKKELQRKYPRHEWR
jgi:ATP-dependent helicase HrpB